MAIKIYACLTSLESRWFKAVYNRALSGGAFAGCWRIKGATTDSSSG